MIMFKFITNLFKTYPEYLFDNLSQELLEYHQVFRDENDLHHLLLNDSDKDYQTSNSIKCSSFNHLQKCVIYTGLRPFLNNYIEEYLKLNPEIIDYQNEHLITALMLACQNSRTLSTEKTVEILLSHYATITLRDIDGNTALMFSAAYSGTESSEQTVKMILSYHQNVNLQNNEGNTVLMIAIKSKESTFGTIQLLLDQESIHLNLKNKKGWSALMFAVYNKNYACIRLLLEKGADINLKNLKGYTALIIASKLGDENAIKILLQFEPNLNLQDETGSTALIYACSSSIAKYLLDSDIKIINNFGESALSISCSNSNAEVVEMLLQKGAEIDKNLVSALKDENIIIILAKYGANIKDISDVNIRKKVKELGYSKSKRLLDFISNNMSVSDCTVCSKQSFVVSLSEKRYLCFECLKNEHIF